MTERIDFDEPTGDEIIVIRVEMVFPDGKPRRLASVITQAELDRARGGMPGLVAAKAQGVATVLQRNLDKQAARRLFLDTQAHSESA